MSGVSGLLEEARKGKRQVAFARRAGLWLWLWLVAVEDGISGFEASRVSQGYYTGGLTTLPYGVVGNRVGEGVGMVVLVGDRGDRSKSREGTYKISR